MAFCSNTCVRFFVENATVNYFYIWSCFFSLSQIMSSLLVLEQRQGKKNNAHQLYFRNYRLWSDI